MPVTLRIPKAAVSMQEGTLAAWLVDDGARVEEGQPIFTLELEKSTMDVEAPAAGMLRQIVGAGTTLKVGAVIGEIDDAVVLPATEMAPPTQIPLASRTPYKHGYVVADLAAAMRAWSETTGAGPFFVFEHFAYIDPRYRNEPAQCDLSLALAYCGGTCIELIQQHDARPSPYLGWTSALHHAGLIVDRVDTALEAYRARGLQPVFTAGFPFGGRCAYVDTTATLGFMIGLSEESVLMKQMLAQVQAAHHGWNRRDLTAKLK